MANKKVTFGIHSIETNQFATIEEVYHDGDEVGIETGFQFGVDRKNQLLKVEFNLKFKCENDPFIILKIACEFEFEQSSFNKFSNKDSDKITVPRNFITHLMVLTLGTARGVLHAKLDNTPFEQFLLPTINISEMVTKDLVFEE